MKKTYKIFSFFALIAVAFTIMGYIYVGTFKNPVEPQDTQVVEFTVEQGESSKQIAKSLKDAGLIKNAMYFGYFSKKNDLVNFKYGVYELKKSDDLFTIAKKLNEGGRPPGQKLTIIEGMKIYDIAYLLENAGIMTMDEFISTTSDKKRYEDEFLFLKEIPDGSLEGYLYPATYFIEDEESPDGVVRKLLLQTQKVFADNDILAAYVGISKEINSLNDFITLSSIVQKESGKFEDMKKIANVFLKRLDIGMLLQSDATTQYVTGENKPRLSAEDIAVDNPYNTYKYKGLPPTPICSPSIDAMEAVLKPEQSDYLYFVADMEGNTYFSTTYEEHLAKTKEIYGEY